MWSCAKEEESAKVAAPVAAESTVPAAATAAPTATPTAAPSISSPFEWADVIELNPDPKVVTDADFLQRITATGFPWKIRDKKSGIELLLVPPGTFMMGLSAGDTEGQNSEKPAHQVKISKAFYLGRTEVTQQQWEKVTNMNPSFFFAPMMPVHRVIYRELESFLKDTDFRLPTEAEWEYACRAGTQEQRYGEIDQVAFYDKNSLQKPHLVGEKSANALGFQDMLGNLQEWCSDWYSSDYYAQCKDGATDPIGPASGKFRVVRGGSWAGISKTCRSSYRFAIEGDYRGDYLGDGFRVARTP